jgi:hypothetical protein
MPIVNQINTANTFLDWLTTTQSLVDLANNTIFYIDTKPTSPVGASGDIKGSVYLANNYIYYCSNNYTGVTNIWSRISSTDSWT